ncbi:MAG: hypothetical protein L3J82_01105 [Planctomycetes bacterium]|nr:hypothetical protein [Planctomycetota bacterium]
MTTKEMSKEQKTQFVREHWAAYLDKELPADEMQVMQDIICNCDYTCEFMNSQEEFAVKLRQAIKEGCTNCPDTLSDRISSALDTCEQELCDDSEPVDNDKKASPFPWFSAVLMALAAAIVISVAVFGGIASGGGSQPASPSLEQVLTPLVANANLSVPAVSAENCKYLELSEICNKLFKGAPEMPLRLDGKHLIVSDFTQLAVEDHEVVTATYDHPNGQRFALMLLSCECLDQVMPKIVKSQEVILEGKNVMFWRRGKYMQVLIGEGDSDSLRQIAMSIQTT